MGDVREVNTVQTEEARIESLGLDFGEVAKIDSPTEAIPALLASLGNIFQCERVYVFEKNEEGCYDCTDEWFSEDTFSKKHLMQNIQEKGVKYYYNYFLRGKNLCVQNMENFKQEDYQLYKILKPQGLQSLICGQLTFDHADIGFFGIDNPTPERFEELRRIFDVINHYVSIQIHRRNLENKIMTESKPIKDANQPMHQYSLYDRVAGIRMEEPLALIYCDVALKYDLPEDEDTIRKMHSHTEKVLGSVFGAMNVFHLGRNEFLIFFEDNEDTDIEDLKQYATIAQNTLDTINIKVSMGVAQTMKYQQNFFDLVHKANVKMLRL
ncbi:MAG: hypothetical protein Q4B26_07590, partial [Eubacteriales bacterium]|nr:hypothetical protein [Eubacteriales bacterium]